MEKLIIICMVINEKKKATRPITNCSCESCNSLKAMMAFLCSKAIELFKCQSCGHYVVSDFLLES
jgi:Zn ribbon nucleic-acid-binding protein